MLVESVKVGSFPTVTAIDLLTYMAFGRHTEKRYVMSRKVKISVTLPEDLLAWMDGLVGERIFDDRSHGLERAVLCLKRRMEKEGQAPREL